MTRYFSTKNIFRRSPTFWGVTNLKKKKRKAEEQSRKKLYGRMMGHSPGPNRETNRKIYQTLLIWKHGFFGFVTHPNKAKKYTKDEQTKKARNDT